METGVKGELTIQEEITSEMVIPQSQETQYFHKLENKLANLIKAKSQLDEITKKVITDQ